MTIETITEDSGAFDAALADRQMLAAVGRNPGWEFRMNDLRDGSAGHHYRFTAYARHTGTIHIDADGFAWEVVSHRDGSPIADGRTTQIAKAFRAVVSGGAS